MPHTSGDSTLLFRLRAWRRAWSVRGNWAHVLWRLFWLVGAAVHLPALAGFWHDLLRDSPAEASAVRGLVLLIGLVFCALKVLDLPVLRANPGWRSRCACVLILLLLHVGMIPGLGDQVTATVEAGTTGVGLAVSLLARGRRMPAVASLRRRACAAATKLQRNPFPREWGTLFHPFDTFLAPAYAGPRAPPRR